MKLYNIIKKIIIKLNMIYILSLLFYICRIFKIKNNKIVCINFNGKGYGDSPKYIADELLKLNKYEIIWIVNDINQKVPNGIKKVKTNSFGYFYHLSTAKVWINNTRFQCFVKKRKKQIYVQTWHAGLGLKKIEKDAIDTLTEKNIKDSINDSKMIDVLISNSSYRTNTFRRCFWYEGEIAETGLPRNDIFFKNNIELQNIKNKVKQIYNIDSNKKIILYAPTFRNELDFDYNSIDSKNIISLLKQKYNEEYVFAYKLHPNLMKRDIKFDSDCINFSKYSDMDELLISADILISDYSSVIFDYLYLSKNIYLYAPDYNTYLDKERGFNFNYEELPFSISYTANELCEKIVNKDYINHTKDIDDFLDNIKIFDNGIASRKVVELIEKKIEEK